MTAIFSDIAINPKLRADTAFCQDWQLLQSAEHNAYTLDGQVEHYINGKQLACPMPLLKLKMALKNTAIGNAVYLTATDPNSKRDIAAFCQHAGFTLFQYTATMHSDDKIDTIFHSIITKNC